MPKNIHGKDLNSQMLLGLAMDFCEAINANDSPKIQTSISRLIAEETLVIADDFFNELKRATEEQLIHEPLSDVQLRRVIKRMEMQAVRSLQMGLSRFYPDFEDILAETKKFKARMEPVLQSLRDANYAQGFKFSK
jgi:hypothetical protein